MHENTVLTRACAIQSQLSLHCALAANFGLHVDTSNRMTATRAKNLLTSLLTALLPAPVVEEAA